MARRRRARRRGFFSRHWKALLVVVIAIILIVVILVVKPFAGISNQLTRNNPSAATAGQLGVITLEGNGIGVFDTESEAEANQVTVNAGKATLKVSGSGNIDVSASIGGTPANILTTTNGNSYELNLDGLGDGTTILVKVMVGGDGSLIGQRLSENVDTHYFAVNVSNPNQQAQTGDPNTQTAQTLGIPNGTVYVDGSAFQTYGSESEAQQAIADQQNRFTLPTSMLTNGLPITVTPNTDDTARVFIQVCMVDGYDGGSFAVCANPETDWLANLDVSQFAGHQITLMIKAENGWAISTGYSYISFFLPEWPVQETETEPAPVG
ncbi:MAG: hypothetical protein IJ629_07390 [Clostridia bacterium]|nr:hypothetical protein [Clostridia bacterium]